MDSGLADIGGIMMSTAVFTSAIGPIEVVCVHINRPVNSTEFNGWTTQLAALRTRVRDRTSPLTFAGDFNATTSHRPFRDMLDAGATGGLRARGKGLANSWPNGRAFPPIIGSDHVPLIVNLARVGPSR